MPFLRNYLDLITPRRWRLITFSSGRYALIIFQLIAILILQTSIVMAQNPPVTYMKNSDHELEIYLINGKEPGNTMMIIGGIQGDEPGGYLAADLYADMLLEKGNLIVVPRANFLSIRQNKRGVNGDMNRKFNKTSREDEDNDYDQINVGTIQNLILKSDILLNLHEGSGFFNPKYISEMKNPMRYGQSIISDASNYKRSDGRIIDLGGPAKRIINKVNKNIKNSDHHFLFNNHNTLADNSKHKEQRKSATYFALTEAGIPSFGIETSKSIKSIEAKVKYQTLIINAFMAEYGIIPENPSISLPVPKLGHLVIQIFGYQSPLAVKNGNTIEIPVGSSIHISDIIANYQRGLSVDILGIGNTNDLGRVSKINSPTTIKVYKDAYLCGEVTIKTTYEKAKKEVIAVPQPLPNRLKQVEIYVDNKKIVVSNGDTLHIVKGDIIEIVDAWATNRSQSGFRINFVGFEGWKFGNKKSNDAEDRGYRIDTGKDLIPRFSLHKRGHIYQIRAENLPTRKLIGRVYIAIDEPKIEYLILERQDGTKLALTLGSVVNCDKMDSFKVLSVITNITSKPYIDTFVCNGSEKSRQVFLPTVLEMSSEMDIQFRRASNNLGSILFRTSG